MSERKMVWHTLESFSVYDLEGDVDRAPQMLKDAVDHAKSNHPNCQLRFDAEYWYRGDDESPRLRLRVFELENDKEYNERIQCETENQERARKQYEELKKRFG